MSQIDEFLMFEEGKALMATAEYASPEQVDHVELYARAEEIFTQLSRANETNSRGQIYWAFAKDAAECCRRCS